MNEVYTPGGRLLPLSWLICFFRFSKSLFKPLLIVSCMEKTLNRGRKEIISFSVLSYLNRELSMSWDMVHVFWIISTVQERHRHSNLFWLGYQEWRLMAPLLFSLRARLFFTCLNCVPTILWIMSASVTPSLSRPRKVCRCDALDAGLVSKCLMTTRRKATTVT